MYEEPGNLLKQELRDPSTYNAILDAIANGASRLNEISTKVHLESGGCSNYLASLITLGIIQKEKPINEPSSKKSMYSIKDQMYRFWYTFVYPNLSLIELGVGDMVYVHSIQEHLSAYLGLSFEEICRQYMLECLKRKKVPFFQSIGRWWGNNPHLKRQEEIDILVLGKTYLIGECKWQMEK